MSSFIATYFAWAAPNILPAMATAAAAVWLLGLLRRGSILPTSAMTLVMPVGAAAAAVAVLSAAAALIGLQPVAGAEAFGIITGVVAGLLMSPRPENG